LVRGAQSPPAPPSEVAALTIDIDGVPVLVRCLLTDTSAVSDLGGAAGLRARLSRSLEKVADKMRESFRRCDHQPTQALAAVELIASAEHLARLPATPNDTMLRVGTLELDLLDRTARRGDRRIKLRTREFQLLKYMMQRADQLLTRAALLKEVWNYKFVPQTNLVDVHMGRLRRKIDEPAESALIRNVRGVGFVLSATPFSHCETPRPAE
jgi:DNA-binding response OmpR family regulator